MSNEEEKDEVLILLGGEALSAMELVLRVMQSLASSSPDALVRHMEWRPQNVQDIIDFVNPNEEEAAFWEMLLEAAERYDKELN